jgi:hypothetical protein
MRQKERAEKRWIDHSRLNRKKRRATELALPWSRRDNHERKGARAGSGRLEDDTTRQTRKAGEPQASRKGMDSKSANQACTG